MAAPDPIALLLQRPVADDPDQLSGDAEIVDWMTVQLARQIAEASDRAAMLRTVWARWRSKLKPEHRQLLDLPANTSTTPSTCGESRDQIAHDHS